jgi:hypothetical protein
MIRYALLLVALVALNFSAALATPTEDEGAARAIFERNLQAIADRDSDAYLACYWSDERLVRNGFGGAERGFDSLAASMDQDSWPDLFEAEELKVFSLVPGVVYGQYRYHVRFGESESRGVSERLFLLTEEGWRIAVTTAFAAPEGAMDASEGDEQDR